MPTKQTPTDRTRLVARITQAYADLGWATPTSFEYGSIGSLYRTLDCANQSLISRGCVTR
jgi:hypothetical protein